VFDSFAEVNPPGIINLPWNHHGIVLAKPHF
jgi:hypothetical protein